MGGSSSTRNTTLPNVSVSPGTTKYPLTFTPLTYVPLLEPTSLTWMPLSTTTSSACRLETVPSTTAQSEFTARPTTSVVPGRSSKQYSFSMPESLNGIG